MHSVCIEGMSIGQFSLLISSDAIDIFKKYAPDDGVCFIQVRSRKTKLGDFRYFKDGRCSQITVNKLLSPDALTFILAHEIAHYIVYSNSRQRTAPHGEMWKSVFGKLLEELLYKNCFSNKFYSEIETFSRNPGATISRRKKLYNMLFPENEEEKNLPTILSIPEEAVFIIPGSKHVYIKKAKRRTRFVCKRTDNNRHYLIHQHLKVILLNN